MITKINIKTILIVGLALLFAACASTGTKVDSNKISEIKKGVTTQQEIREMFGKPRSVSSGSSGRATWTYSYASVNSVGNTIVSAIPIPGSSFLAPDSKTKSSVLMIMFDENGVVRDYHYSDSEN